MLILKSHNFHLVCPTPVAKLATPAKQQIVARTSVLISLVNIYFACIHKTLLERSCIHRTDCGFIFLPAIKQHCSCTDLLAFNIHSVEASTDSNKAQEILWEVLHKQRLSQSTYSCTDWQLNYCCMVFCVNNIFQHFSSHL